MQFLAKKSLLPTVLGIMLLAGNGFAATERIVDYEYDNAGNVIRIITQEQSDPPVVSPLSPAFINQGQSRTFTTSGSNLLDVEVSTDAPGLSIDAIESDSSQLSFLLSAADNAQLGDAIIRFSTGLGEVQQTIVVAEVGPNLSTNPRPLAVDTSGSPNTVTLEFSVPRPEDETYTLATIEPAIATVDSTSFTILEGQTSIDISLTGVTAGATVLTIDQAQKFYSYRFPVYVSETFVELLQTFPDMGVRNLFGLPVGVVVQDDNLYLPNRVNSGPVGVLVDSNAATFSKPVGIFYGDAGGGRLQSKPVGVIVSSSISYARTLAVGTIYGPYLVNSQPAAASIDGVTDIEVSGFNLAGVTSVGFEPAGDIVVGVINSNPEGTLLTFSVSVDALAATGLRELILEDANGPIDIGPGVPLTLEIQ